MKTHINKMLLNDKTRVVLNNVAGAFFIKGLGLCISLFSMPLYMKFFSDQMVLGLWFSIISVLTWILTFDLGLGNGLRNKLVEVLAKNDKIKAKEYISSAYFLISIVSILFIIIGWILFRIINLNALFNISENVINPTVLSFCINILFTGIIISFVLKLINSILFALQKSAANNLLSLVTSIIPLGYILFTNTVDMESNLINLSYVQIAANCLPLIIMTILVFNSKELKGCAPNYKFFKINIGKEILNLGGLFFIVQIFFMLLNSTNDILISNLYGPNYVVEYQIYFKLFTIVGSLFTLALSPVWSAVTKAITEKDFKWIIKVNRILLKITSLAVIAEFILILILQIVVNIWLRENSIEVNYLYAVIFALFGALFILNIVLTTVSNGIGYLRTQIICFGIGVFVKIPIILFLNSFYDEWINVIISNIIIFSIFCSVQFFWQQNYIKKLKENN